MKKSISLFLITVIAFTLLSACADGNNMEVEPGKESSNVDVTVEEDKLILESLDNPLMSYYSGSLYDDYITLDITEFFWQYAQERGATVEAVHTFLHVKLTQNLKVVSTNGNEMTVNEISEGDKVFLDFNFSERQSEFKGNEAMIETDLLIVENDTH
ncbi:hypothetical protein [Halalkalibacter nanhaiisediminis]|uniref:Uncharacterized protein n=1 Tax=Halalkalibacter nanhaiisediminis TaxID=688079 RepID=A0A562QRH0_9BACI|nr:hypothetical protein [Halalkalibacter nanhaiisediminis]TWI59297.1 hypothetical protein IQ10_01013 [Halalkalibacter nanhaiisediminis]